LTSLAVEFQLHEMNWSGAIPNMVEIVFIVLCLMNGLNPTITGQ